MSDFIKRPIISVAVRYGLIAGVFGFGLMVLLYYINRHPFLVPLFFDFRIILFSILLVFCLKEVRDYYQQGILHFWQAMIGCFLFTLTFAFLCSLFIYLFALWNPEFVLSYVELGVAQIKSVSKDAIEQLGKERFNTLLLDIPKTTGYMLARQFFFQSFVISFFLSIIISVILRRTPKYQ